MDTVSLARSTIHLSPSPSSPPSSTLSLSLSPSLTYSLRPHFLHPSLPFSLALAGHAQRGDSDPARVAGRGRPPSLPSPCARISTCAFARVWACARSSCAGVRLSVRAYRRSSCQRPRPRPCDARLSPRLRDTQLSPRPRDTRLRPLDAQLTPRPRDTRRCIPQPTPLPSDRR
jgi:hypothetical protein